jgi:hypothetical protein
MQKEETYKITVRDGLFTEDIIGQVKYNCFSAGVNEIEFIGRAIGKTEYYSHFFYPKELEGRTIEEYLTEFVNNTSVRGKVESITKIDNSNI